MLAIRTGSATAICATSRSCRPASPVAVQMLHLPPLAAPQA
jgi:hypothetical protein